jgi:outer membrane receptor protein involved in Fe transport
VIGIKTTGEWVYGNSFTRADAFLAYRFGRSGRLPDFIKNLSLQLNVYNVLDQHDPLIMNVANINAATLAINRLRPQDPRYWRLTADFSF